MARVETALRQTPVEAGVAGGGVWDGKTLSRYLEEQLGVGLKARQCQRLFRQLGFRLRKPRPLIARADPQAQATHKKTSRPGKNPAVDLWAIDEVHFQQHGSRARMWVPPEVDDPVVLHHPTRKSAGYFGAVRLRDGKFIFGREASRFDAGTAWNFLRQLRRCSRRAGRRVVVISDNARHHHARLHAAWRAEQEPGFLLSYLPPYSPDLNPIERVWKLTRRLCLHNRYFPTLPLRRSKNCLNLGNSPMKRSGSCAPSLITCAFIYDAVYSQPS